MKLLSNVSILCFCIMLLASCKSNTQATSVDGAYLNDIELAQLKDFQEKEGIVILDVRTQGEVDAGSIPGMVHIDISSNDFDEQIAKLDKDTEYIVYCKSGGRSSRACKKMAEMGFTKLNNLKGGYKAYNKSNN